MLSDDVYLCIIEGIYDAATDPSLWPAALEKLAAPSRGKAFLAVRDPQMAAALWPTIYVGMEQDWLDAYFRHYANTVAWISKVPSRAVGVAAPSEKVISRSDLEKTEWYNDFLKPQGLIGGIGMTVVRDRPRFVSTGLLVPLETEALHAEQIGLLQRVSPHMARALKVNRQLAGTDFRWQIAEQCFDRLSLGVILLSADMRVQFANAEAERILCKDDGLGRSREGHLFAASADDDVRLRTCVRTSWGGSATRPERDGDGVLSIRRRSGERSYGLLIAGVRPPSAAFGSVEPVAIVFVSEGRWRQASAEMLAETFGLTPAESRLLRILLQGQGLTEAAAQLGNSVNTAKTHLRALFDKLDCSRQSDLVRIVTSHPIWLAGQGQRGGE